MGLNNIIKTRLESITQSKTFSNIIWLTADKMFKMFTGVFVGAWVARYLGATNLGILNYYIAIINILLAIGALGMDGFLVKEIVSRKELKFKLLGTSFILRYIAILSLLIISVVSLLLSNINRQELLIFCLLFISLLCSPFDLIDVDYQSQLKSKRTIIAKNCAYVIGVLVKIFFLLKGYGLVCFALIYSLETVMASSILVFQYSSNKSRQLLQWKWDKATAAHILKEAWPFMITSLAITLYMRVDQIMLKNILGNKETGEFSAAVRLTELFYFIPMAFASSFLPTLVEAKAISRQLLLKKVQLLTFVLLAIAIFIAAAMSIFSATVIRLLYGPAFAESALLLSVYTWALVPIFLGVATSQYYVVEGINKLSFYRTAAGLILNIGLNIILIPLYKSMGSVISTLIAQAFACIFSHLLFRRTRVLIRVILNCFNPVYIWKLYFRK